MSNYEIKYDKNKALSFFEKNLTSDLKKSIIVLDENDKSCLENLNFKIDEGESLTCLGKPITFTDALTKKMGLLAEDPENYKKYNASFNTVKDKLIANDIDRFCSENGISKKIANKAKKFIIENHFSNSTHIDNFINEFPEIAVVGNINFDQEEFKNYWHRGKANSDVHKKYYRGSITNIGEDYNVIYSEEKATRNIVEMASTVEIEYSCDDIKFALIAFFSIMYDAPYYVVTSNEDFWFQWSKKKHRGEYCALHPFVEKDGKYYDCYGWTDSFYRMAYECNHWCDANENPDNKYEIWELNPIIVAKIFEDMRLSGIIGHSQMHGLMACVAHRQ